MDYDEEDEEDERMLDEKSGLCVSPDSMAGNATRHPQLRRPYYIYRYIYLYKFRLYIYLCNQTPPTEKARWGSIPQSDFIFQLR